METYNVLSYDFVRRNVQLFVLKSLCFVAEILFEIRVPFIVANVCVGIDVELQNVAWVNEVKGK
jgi:hypothetical protein